MEKDRYKIYQIRDGSPGQMYRFMGTDFIEKHGLTVKAEDYELMYSGKLQKESLEDIYIRFNIERPDDFKGHSLSVSDVVVMERDGKATANYIDSFGYSEVPDFCEKRKELDAEQLAEEETLDKAFQLATDVDKFIYDYDPYQYADGVVLSERMHVVQKLYEEIVEGNCEGSIHFLKDIAEEDEIPENIEGAKALITRLEEFCKPLDQEQMLTFESQFLGDIQVQIEVQQYMNNGSLYIGMISFEDGYPEPYGDVTVNLDGKVSNYCGYLDTNNMPTLEKFITENGLGEFTGFTKQSGFCEFPLYQFNAEKLRELSPDGMKTYEDSIGVKKTPDVKEKAR